MALQNHKKYYKYCSATNAVVLCIAVILASGSFTYADSLLPTEPALLDTAQIRSLSTADPNLTGEGVMIGAICRSITYDNDQPKNDYRFNMNHNSLYDADVLFADGTEGHFGISAHATSIAGILLGLDDQASHPEAGTFNYRGICPEATVNAYEFEQFSNLYLYEKRNITEDIVLLSLGNIFEEWWVRALEKAADDDDFLIVASIGNGTNSISASPLYPGAGSNVLGVGVVDSIRTSDGSVSLSEFSTPKATHSSSGPTHDQRCKPDIVAPGTALVPTASGQNGYELEVNWSSLASPVVAGTAALLEQKAMTDTLLKQDYDRPGKSQVLKAILMNAAKKLPYWHKGKVSNEDDHQTPLDFAQGAGLLDGVAAMEQLTAGTGKPGSVKTTGWDNRHLTNSNQKLLYGFNVTEPNQIVTATLCWSRHYESEYPFSHMAEQDADLRLELWGIKPEDPNGRALLDYSDSVNDNVEHIHFPCDPDYTSYVISVRFNDEQPLDMSVKQRFAVAWHVGPDRQLENPWWDDLNGDNHIDEVDRFVYKLIKHGLAKDVDLASSFDISPAQINLLTEGQAMWEPYWSQTLTK